MINLDKIIKFKNCLCENIKIINEKVSKRKRKLNFKDILFYSVYKNGNNYSYETTNSHLKFLNIAETTKQTLSKRRKSIDPLYFKQLNDELINFIYKNDKDRRFIAIDGSKINLDAKFGKQDIYKLSKNKNYSTALISSIYDVNKRMPINYEIYKSFNEREALVDQLNYFKKGDVAIMDRGYYSKILLEKFINIGVDPIFRIPKGLTIVKTFIDLNKDDYVFDFEINHQKIIKFRIIKYKINKEMYYIGTTLINKQVYTLLNIINLYKKRWTVETDFKYSKYNLSLESLSSKSTNLIKQDIYVHNFILIFESFIRNSYFIDDNEKFKMNTTNALVTIVNKILYKLLYKKFTKKVKKLLMKIIKIIVNIKTVIKNNRHYVRLRKKPASKWCQNAIKLYNKYASKKKK
jgi:hypothetical protein